MATDSASKTIVAYYSLVFASIGRQLLPEKVIKGLGKYDIPAMLLARLAVDRRHQGKGLGRALLKDAVLRTMQAAKIAGLKILLVDAKDLDAAEFYQKHGFEPLVNDPLRLMLPVPLSN